MARLNSLHALHGNHIQLLCSQSWRLLHKKKKNWINNENELNWILSFIVALQKLKTQTKSDHLFSLTFVYFCNIWCCEVYVWLQIQMYWVHIGFVDVDSASRVFWFSHSMKQSLYHVEEFSLYQVIRSWNAEWDDKWTLFLWYFVKQEHHTLS